MRIPLLVALLALSGTALSGCTSLDSVNTLSASSGGGTVVPPGNTAGGGVSGDVVNGGTGEANDVNLTAGDITIAYAQGARSIDGSGRTRLTVSPAGASATVSIDPGPDIGFKGQSTMGLFKTETPAQNAAAANYSEFRRITTDSDTELQLWSYDNPDGASYAGQYRNVTAGQKAWFYGGTGATDTAAMPTAGTASYAGRYVGIASVGGYLGQPENYQTANGEWRFNGSAQLSADFGAATLTGTLTPEYWEKYETDGRIAIDVVANQVHRTDGAVVAAGNQDIANFHVTDVTLNGTITGNTVTGTASLDPTKFVNGDNTVRAGFYGPNADQITGVFATYAVDPSPQGGSTGINDDRRGTVDMQGAFHGAQ